MHSVGAPRLSASALHGNGTLANQVPRRRFAARSQISANDQQGLASEEVKIKMGYTHFTPSLTLYYLLPLTHIFLTLFLNTIPYYLLQPRPLPKLRLSHPFDISSVSIPINLCPIPNKPLPSQTPPTLAR